MIMGKVKMLFLVKFWPDENGEIRFELLIESKHDLSEDFWNDAPNSRVQKHIQSELKEWLISSVTRITKERI